MRLSKSIVVIVSFVVAGLVWVVVGAHAAQATSTVHSVSKGSETNYSSAVEDPIWGFTCTAATGAWHFEINDVQVIDSAGHPWDDSTGPWKLTVFAGKNNVGFSGFAHLHQNRTNGLFEAAASGTAAHGSTWCATGVVASVVGFSSGGSEPLLLDGTLS